MPVLDHEGVASYVLLTQGVIFTFRGLVHAGQVGLNPPTAPRVAPGSLMEAFVGADAWLL